jgi:hypothetical protein
MKKWTEKQNAMYNLLDKLQPFRVCSLCHKRKPIADYLTTSDDGTQQTNSPVCRTCRAELADDEGRGGKQNSLSIDHNRRDFDKKKQKEKHEKKEASTEDYIDSIDKEHAKDLADKKTERQRRIKDLNIPKTGIDKKARKDTGEPQDSMDPASAEYGYFPDFHDPFKQRPTSEHHNISATHPDRMDVKFLLECIISGRYSPLPAYLTGIGMLAASAWIYGVYHHQPNYHFSHAGNRLALQTGMVNTPSTLPPGAPQLAAINTPTGAFAQQQARQSTNPSYQQPLAAGSLAMLSLAQLTIRSFKPNAFMLPQAFRVAHTHTPAAKKTNAFFGRAIKLPISSPTVTPSKKARIHRHSSSFQTAAQKTNKMAAPKQQRVSSSHFKAENKQSKSVESATKTWSQFIKKVWR